MVNTSDLVERVSGIAGFVGGEYYRSLRSDPRFFVYNRYDRDMVSRPHAPNILLYQTDDPLTPERLAAYRDSGYSRIYSCNNTVPNGTDSIQLPLGIVDTGSSISFALAHIRHGFSVWDLIRRIRDEESREPDTLLYLNFRVNIDARKDALHVADGLSESDVISRCTSGNAWLFGADESGYCSYLRDISRCAYVACPSGFGIDTYRFYETLYMGRIPVVLRNPVVSSLTGLPVLVLDRWCEFDSARRQFEECFSVSKISYAQIDRGHWDRVFKDTEE